MKKHIIILIFISYSLTNYAQEKELKVSAKTLKTYVGKYEVAPNVIADVTTDEKHIYLQLTGQQKFEFIAVEKHTFYFKGLDVKVVFNPNKKKEIESLTIYQDRQTATAKKINYTEKKGIRASTQTGEKKHNLVFDSIDLKIIQKANSILSNSTNWNKQDDRRCNDDIANGRYSLYCTLYKASIDIMGEYIHRKPAMQIVRFTLEKYENGRVVNHRLKDWNNHPDTNFEEVKKILKESIDEVKRQLEKSSKK